MAKRDPEKTKRNKLIDSMGKELKQMLPEVLRVTGIESEQSLHAVYGGKNAEFIDIKHEVIHTPDHFVSVWLRGFMEYLERGGPYMRNSAFYRNFKWLQEHPIVLEYVFLFLQRTFLRNYEALSKARPPVEEAAIWIGQERASYGLFVTPRFNARTGNWENDESEIRHFKKHYWTVGHLLQTGLAVPYQNAKINFQTVSDYLAFFEHTIVRASGSPHEAAIAAYYVNFVLNSPQPEDVPLLIPEYRYRGIDPNHEYRLDFCVINPFTMYKVGFELSPWSTHGRLQGLKGLTQQRINEMAQANFEEEMRKLKNFFRKHKIHIQVYTDSDLADHAAVFADIAKWLSPEKAEQQMSLAIRDELMKFEL